MNSRTHQTRATQFTLGERSVLDWISNLLFCLSPIHSQFDYFGAKLPQSQMILSRYSKEDNENDVYCVVLMKIMVMARGWEWQTWIGYWVCTCVHLCALSTCVHCVLVCTEHLCALCTGHALHNSVPRLSYFDRAVVQIRCFCLTCAKAFIVCQGYLKYSKYIKDIQHIQCILNFCPKFFTCFHHPY